MIKIILFLLYSLFINTSFLYSVTYYVKTNGNNLASGTSWANAWETPQHAADQVTNGDTVLFAAGIYRQGGFTVDSYNGRLVITNSGTTAQPITFKVYTNGALISGLGLNNGIYIVNASNIIIDGFEVASANNNGILLSRGANKNKIIRCDVHDNVNNGISIGRSTINNDWDSYGNCDYNTIVSNVTYKHLGGASAGIFVYCSAGNNLNYNISYRNSRGLLIYARGISTDINYFRYNMFYTNTMGIFLSYKNERAGHDDTIIENCVIAYNTSIGMRAECSYVQIKNSIVYKNGWGLYEDRSTWANWTTDIQTTYNAVCSNGTDYISNGDGLSAGTGDINVDPQFLTLATRDFNTAFLLKNKYTPLRGLTGETLISPCIDNGDYADPAVLPDIRIDIGLNNTTNCIGYPDLPYNLGPPERTNGSSTINPIVTLSCSLIDSVMPTSMDNLRYIIELSTNAGFSPIATVSTSTFAPAGSRTYISPALGLGSYYWRVKTEDNKQGTYGNTSEWTYANNGNVAFIIVPDLTPWISITSFAHGDKVLSMDTISGTMSYVPNVTNVSLMIQRSEDNMYWNSTNWQSSAVWFKGNITSQSTWNYDSSAISNSGIYTVSARAKNLADRSNISASLSYSIVKILITSIRADDGIHTITIDPEANDTSKKVACNSGITLNLEIEGDIYPTSKVNLIYGIGTHPLTGNTIEMNRENESWQVIIPADKTELNPNSIFYFQINVDDLIVENTVTDAPHNSWGFTLGEIITQKDDFTILNNVTKKNSDTPISIIYSVKKRTAVKIGLYTINGDLIKQLINQEQNPDTYVLTWNGRNNINQYVSRGLYLVIGSIENKRIIRKILIK